MAVSLWSTLAYENLTISDDKYKIVAQIRSNKKIVLFELRIFADGLPTKMGLSMKPDEIKWIFDQLSGDSFGTYRGRRQIFVEPHNGGAIITLVGNDWPRVLFLKDVEIRQLKDVYDKLWPCLYKEASKLGLPFDF